MKNLHTEKATMPKIVKSVISKFLYSFCAACLVTATLLSVKALPVNGGGDAVTGSGYDANDAYCIPDMELGVNEYYWESHYNSDSPLTNNYGSAGNDKWLKVTINSYCYLHIATGSTCDSNFDPVLHLLDSSQNLLTTVDDGTNGPSPWTAEIVYFVSPGTYYIILDGTDKMGHVKNSCTGLGIYID